MAKIINLTISEQSAIVATKRLPVAGSKGLYKVHPIFDDEWSEIDRKLIAFVWARPVKYGTPKTIKLAVEYDGTNDVVIPLSVIDEVGTLTIGALGYKGEDVVRITTNADQGQIQIVDAVMKDTSEASGDSEDAVDIWAQVAAELAGKQDKLTAGDGITITDETAQDGTTQHVLSVAQADADNYGVVKIGQNLSIGEDGKLNADAQPAILYNTTGNKTDGAMTQAATTNELAKKEPRLTAGAGLLITDETDEQTGETTHTIAVDAETIPDVADIPQSTSDLTNDGADGTDTYIESSDLAAVEAEIPTTVAELTDANDYATKTYVDSACSSVYRVKGSVATYADLTAIQNKEVGDCYSVSADNMNYVWTGSAWDQMAPTIDLSGYATTAYVNQQIGDIESALATITTGTGA